MKFGEFDCGKKIKMMFRIKYVKYLLQRIYYEIYFNIKPRDSSVKISFIIPTIWRSDFLEELVEKLTSSQFAGEIILIDNAGENGRGLSRFSKLKVVNSAHNLYVNPSWNLGAKMAQYDYICLCNDDIIFDIDKTLKLISRALPKCRGIIGVDRSCLGKVVGWPWVRLKLDREFPFGILMFMRREYYVEIPNELKIWYGDDYLFTKIKGPHLTIKGINISTKMSSSSASPQFDAIKQEDRSFWNKIKCADE
jgi:hypothetical protein